MGNINKEIVMGPAKKYYNGRELQCQEGHQSQVLGEGTPPVGFQEEMISEPKREGCGCYELRECPKQISINSNLQGLRLGPYLGEKKKLKRVGALTPSRSRVLNQVQQCPPKEREVQAAEHRIRIQSSTEETGCPVCCERRLKCAGPPGPPRGKRTALSFRRGP